MVKTVGVKAFLFFLLFVCVFVFPVSPIRAEEMRMDDLLQQAFARTGAKADGYTVSSYMVINREFVDTNGLKAFAATLNGQLNIKNPQEYQIQEATQNLYQIYGHWTRDTQVSLVLTSMRYAEQQPKTTMVIRIEKNSPEISDLADSIQRVRDAVGKTSGSPEISTCIRGFLDDKMDSMGRNDLISHLFRSLKIEEKETFPMEQMTLASGYSPLSKGYTLIGGHKVNIQLVIFASGDQRKTYLMVGSPIVSTE